MAFFASHRQLIMTIIGVPLLFLMIGLFGILIAEPDAALLKQQNEYRQSLQEIELIRQTQGDNHAVNYQNNDSTAKELSQQLTHELIKLSALRMIKARQ